MQFKKIGMKGIFEHKFNKNNNFILGKHEVYPDRITLQINNFFPKFILTILYNLIHLSDSTLANYINGPIVYRIV